MPQINCLYPKSYMKIGKTAKDGSEVFVRYDTAHNKWLKRIMPGVKVPVLTVKISPKNASRAFWSKEITKTKGMDITEHVRICSANKLEIHTAQYKSSDKLRSKAVRTQKIIDLSV